MKRALSNLLRAVLLARRTYPTPMTGDAQIRELVGGLKPRRTERGLVRLGPAGDGGYLVPDDLEGITACYSPGVADVSGFERDCAERGMKVFMADHSVDGPAESHELFDFRKKYLGVVQDERCMTLDAWVESTTDDDDSDLLLQIDVEGAEYEIFLGASDRLLRRFRIIVAEFHDLHLLRSEPFFRIASRSLRKLLKTHVCVHIHPNNCCGSETVKGLEIPRIAEFTFLRADRISAPGYVTSFPHPLDCDNTENESLPLPPWWYAP